MKHFCGGRTTSKGVEEMKLVSKTPMELHTHVLWIFEISPWIWLSIPILGALIQIGPKTIERMHWEIKAMDTRKHEQACV